MKNEVYTILMARELDWSTEDTVTNEIMMDAYVHLAGVRGIVGTISDAVFSNGFTEDVPAEKILEMQKAYEYILLYGFAVLLTDDEGNLEAMEPLTNGQGFKYTELDERGMPLVVDVHDGYGGISKHASFFPLRGLKGPSGPRGLSLMLPLVKSIKVQYEIFMDYARYAKDQGLSSPVLKVPDLYTTDGLLEAVQSQVGTSIGSKEKLKILDMDSDLSWVSPQKNSYNPLPLLKFADEYVSRTTAMSKLQLSGDPGGMIATSETATANWVSAVERAQALLLAQYKPVLVEACGCSEDVEFNSPAENTTRDQMETVKLIRDSLGGLVRDEDLLRLVNRELGLSGEKELRGTSVGRSVEGIENGKREDKGDIVRAADQGTAGEGQDQDR